MPPIGGSVLLIQNVRWFESNFIYRGRPPNARVAQLVERGSYDNNKIAQGRGFKPRLEHPFFKKMLLNIKACMAEWSKASGLGPDVFAHVGSNPTTCTKLR